MDTADNRDLLMTYTIFHIGTYISLAAAILAAQAFGNAVLAGGVLRFSLAMFVLAGACGAIVGSHISDSKDWSDYTSMKMGPLGFPIATYWWWAKAEHIFFWAGVLVPVLLAIFNPSALGIVGSKGDVR
jgi:hypothetical protein